HVINNRRHGFADARAWIFLLQTMSRDETFGYRLFDRRREIHVVDALKTRAGIEHAWLETRRRQLHERMTFANGDRFGHGYNFSYKLAHRLTRECQRRFDFGVLWKIFGVREIKRAARGFKTIRPLLSSLERVRNLMNVTQVKVCSIHQNASAFFGNDIESPQGRFGKGIFDGKTFVRIVCRRAKVVVRRHQQNSRPHSIESNDHAVAELPTIEADVV